MVIKRRGSVVQIHGESHGGTNFRHGWIQELTWWHQTLLFPFCFPWNLFHFQEGPLHVAIKVAQSSSSLTLFWKLENSDEGLAFLSPASPASHWSLKTVHPPQSGPHPHCRTRVGRAPWLITSLESKHLVLWWKKQLYFYNKINFSKKTDNVSHVFVNTIMSALEDRLILRLTFTFNLF